MRRSRLAGHLKLNGPDRAVGPQQHHHRRLDLAFRPRPTRSGVSKPAGWITDSCDGHDAADIFRALTKAQEADKPVMIACRTIIGFGMPGREGTQKAHCDAPGAEVVAGARKELHWDYPPFVVPDDLLNQWRAIGKLGVNAYDAWTKHKAASRRAKEFDDTISDVIPASLGPALVELKEKTVSRKAQGRHPQNVGEGAGRHQWRAAEHNRRLGRSDAVQQHPAPRA